MRREARSRATPSWARRARCLSRSTSRRRRPFLRSPSSDASTARQATCERALERDCFRDFRGACGSATSRRELRRRERRWRTFKEIAPVSLNVLPIQRFPDSLGQPETARSASGRKRTDGHGHGMSRNRTPKGGSRSASRRQTGWKTALRPGERGLFGRRGHAAATRAAGRAAGKERGPQAGEARLSPSSGRLRRPEDLSACATAPWSQARLSAQSQRFRARKPVELVSVGAGEGNRTLV